MEKELSLATIGSTVNINLQRINENLSNDLKQLLSEHPYGKVVGYKITDGVDIGLILELKNGENFWFFEEEVNTNTKNYKASKYISNKAITNYKRFNYSREFKEVLNPLNFIKWVRISLNDVI